jgi:hypothetical protein
MVNSMSRHRQETFASLGRLGFTPDEAATLVRASARLHSWAEHECNGAIQRDEKTDIPYWHSTYDGKRMGRAVDAETGALKRVAKIAESRGFKVYHQTDPRGCALYLYRPIDLDNYRIRVSPEKPSIGIDCCYNSVGTAICP